jgi:ubiquinone/menaquinone biosynthesis C-methylase UbiE
MFASNGAQGNPNRAPCFAKRRRQTKLHTMNPLLLLATLALSVITGAWPVRAQVGATNHLTSTVQPPLYQTNATHDPEGLGKFYQGREIAKVMGHAGADWLERPERQEEERPDLLLSALKIKPGDKVADIGAGTGYYTRRMGELVGREGTVFAVNIEPEMLESLKARTSAAGIHNVQPVLGTLKSPRLPRDSLDLVLMVDVYHELEFPYEMMQEICWALKPGGRIALVEFRSEDPKVPIKAVHKMTEAQARKELELLTLRWLETNRTLPWQHLMFFERTAKPRD